MMANAKGNIALGIDLGTTNSCVAVYRNGRAETIPHTITSARVTPSWVTYTDDQVLVGQIAKDYAPRNSLGSVYGIKRVIGKKYNDPTVKEVAQNWKFGVIEDSGALKLEVLHKNEKKQIYPEEISGLILREMKEIAQAFLGENNITDAVITVPAYFNDNQRQATIDAANIAKLNVLRLINEPTAAAIAYLFDKPEKKERNILVYDLGGGTFDVSIVRLEGFNIKVKASRGDTNLGGTNFDDRCVAYFCQIFQDKYSMNVTETAKLKLSLLRFRSRLEKAKHDLSSIPTTHIEFDAICGENDFQDTFTRARFDDINEDLYRRTLEIVEQCVSEANLSIEEIDDILLVGGSSRIPQIEVKLEEMFGKPIRKDIHRDESVALGAAILAANLNGTLQQELNIQDVTSVSLGIETMNDEMSFLINRNTQIPTKKTFVYTTAHPEDDAIKITVLEGDNESAKKNLVLGVFDLLDLPKDPSVKVTFKIDINGILTVKAVETSTGIKKAINVKAGSEGRLNAKEITRLQRNSNAIKENNEECNAISEKRNQYESYHFGMKNNVKENKYKISATSMSLGTEANNITQQLSSIVFKNNGKDCSAVTNKRNKFEKYFSDLKNDVQGNKYNINAKNRDITLNIIEEALKWLTSKDALDINNIDKKYKTMAYKCADFLNENKKMWCPSKLYAEVSQNGSPAIGIYLGITNSCVAIYRYGRAEIIVNNVGGRTTPSYVGFKNETILIGAIALHFDRHLLNTVFGFKRLIGKRFNDSTVQNDIKNWPFNVVNQNGKPQFKITINNQEKFYRPEKISSLIIEYLKEAASRFMETKITKAVITVPAYFNKAQRQATKDAGKLAGLEALKLLDEPTAAAIAYTFDKNDDQLKYVMVFKLGGETFEVSIIKLVNGRITVKASDSDTHLGGTDFNNQLMNYLIQNIKENHNFDIKKHKTALARLRSQCENSKQELSFQSLSRIQIDYFINGDDYEYEITRERFEDLNEDLFKKTLVIVQNCLNQAGMRPDEIHNVVLVGGSTRIPRIRELLKDFFDGKVLSHYINPDEAVALGAAIHAGELNKHGSEAAEDFNLEYQKQQIEHYWE